jgi:hypothetical protein
MALDQKMEEELTAEQKEMREMFEQGIRSTDQHGERLGYTVTLEDIGHASIELVAEEKHLNPGGGKERLMKMKMVDDEQH